MMGSTPVEAKQAGQEYQRYYLDRGDNETAEQALVWPEDEINDLPVAVATFEIGRYPITNAQYALFVSNDGYNPVHPWWDAFGREWLKHERRSEPRYWHHLSLGIACANKPVVGVSWYEAIAFCCWLSQNRRLNPEGYTYLLPHENEWEFAARGSEKREFPWGNEKPDTERSNYFRLYQDTVAVGCFPLGRTPETVSDMAGNVWEWTNSIYTAHYTRNGQEETTTIQDRQFAIRGGGWSSYWGDLRAAYRLANSPKTASYSLGFRLIRRLPV